MIEADRLIAPENPAFRDEDVIDRAIRPKKVGGLPRSGSCP